MSYEWPLRVGFALMYFYSGSDLISHPQGWYWAIPQWFAQLVSGVMPLDAYLKVQGVGEIVIGIALLAWFLKPAVVKWFALLAAIEMAGIVFLSGINSITFRDIGLLGGALALVMITWRKKATIDI